MNINNTSNRICPKCGKPLGENDVFCGNCGTKYEVAALGDVNVTSKSGHSHTKPIIIAFVLLALLSLLIITKPWQEDGEKSSITNQNSSVQNNTNPVDNNNVGQLLDVNGNPVTIDGSGKVIRDKEDMLALLNLEKLFSIANEFKSEEFDFATSTNKKSYGTAEMNYRQIQEDGNLLDVVAFDVMYGKDVVSSVTIYKNGDADISYARTYKDAPINFDNNGTISTLKGDILCSAIGKRVFYLDPYTLEDFDIIARRADNSQELTIPKGAEPMYEFRYAVENFYESTIPDVIDTFLSLHEAGITANDLGFR